MAATPLDPDHLQQHLAVARDRRRARLTRIGPWEYLQFTGKYKSVPEGTVVFGDTVIWGYPRIGRILQLDTGIPSQFAGPFWVEEKIDGYNVRLFRHGPDTLAVTRRGYICPFTTDRLDDLLDTRLLEERPELVLCAEVAGPENPYNEGSPPFIREDVQLFVFDVMRKDHPGCLPYREKTDLLEQWRLPAVPRLGRFGPDELAAVKEIILRFDGEGREGIVLKEDAPRDRRVKYVTGSSNVVDIRVNEGNIQQLPAEYFMHRILRLALFLEEHGIEPTPVLCRRLGESLINGTLAAIGQYRQRSKVYHTFRCRFRQRANAELMMRDIRQRLGKYQVRRRRLKKIDGYYVLEFDKVLPRTTGLFAQLLKGGLVFD
ncbi:MAG: RNA ligase [Pseudomonadota bacterium]|nr:RNA ligase [Pseudomonadota bacterium]